MPSDRQSRSYAENVSSLAICACLISRTLKEAPSVMCLLRVQKLNPLLLHPWNISLIQMVDFASFFSFHSCELFFSPDCNLFLILVLDSRLVHFVVTADSNQLCPQYPFSYQPLGISHSLLSAVCEKF